LELTMRGGARRRAAVAAVLVAIVLLGPRLATQAAPLGQIDAENVVLQITSPAPGQRLRGAVEIAGYAADRRSASGSGMNERDLQVWLNDVADPRNLLTYAQPGRPSLAAAATLGAQFAQVGFTAAWETCAFPPGPYTLLVWGSSLVAPGARNVAAEEVEVEPCPPATPLLSLDLAANPGGLVRSPQPGYFGHGVAPLFADFAAGIDARCSVAHEGCRYGIEFRRLPGPGVPGTDSYYSYLVNPFDRHFVLDFIQPGEGGGRVVRVVPWTESRAIGAGTATNRLGVVAEGDELRLFVNGERIAEVRDDGRRWGRIGWGAGPGGPDYTLEVQFRRLVVTTPGPVDALARVLRGS
jgi:hypothetical protein